MVVLNLWIFFDGGNHLGIGVEDVNKRREYLTIKLELFVFKAIPSIFLNHFISLIP
jgi:hypothetical protein